MPSRGDSAERVAHAFMPVYSADGIAMTLNATLALTFVAMMLVVVEILRANRKHW